MFELLQFHLKLMSGNQYQMLGLRPLLSFKNTKLKSEDIKNEVFINSDNLNLFEDIIKENQNNIPIDIYEQKRRELEAQLDNDMENLVFD